MVETGNGGELVKRGNDLYLISGFSNMIYLALFGGNIEAVTTNRQTGDLAYDFWGNNLLMPQKDSIQFNSRTEAALKNTPLTSAGRLIIQQAVEKDLEFMDAFAIVTVNVVIVSTFKVKININVEQPASISGSISDQYRAFSFIWDGTAQNLIGDFSALDFNNDFF